MHARKSPAMSVLSRSLFGLPVSGGDKRLKAHAADDLFKGRVTAACRDKKGADRDLRRVLGVFAGQPPKPQSCACRCLAQQGAHMRLLLTLAAQFNRVMGFDLDSAEWLLVDETDNRSQEQVRADNESAGKQACNELTSPGKGSDHRRAPNGPC